MSWMYETGGVCIKYEPLRCQWTISMENTEDLTLQWKKHKSAFQML